MLSRTEEIILLSVCRLDSGAFGLSIRQDVEKVTGRRHSVGGIYVPLERLVNKGYLSARSEIGASERLGRPRRRFTVTSDGLRALSEVKALSATMWSGLPDPISDKLNLSLGQHET
jgi:PadR family transcriptional regulator PadR